MTKIIEINNCGQCPYYSGTDKDQCEYLSRGGWGDARSLGFVKITEFPFWCPLPNKGGK